MDLESSADGHSFDDVTSPCERLRAEILKLFAEQGAPLSPEGHQRLDACSDAKVLERWYERALVAAVEAEVFRPWSERPEAR